MCTHFIPNMLDLTNDMCVYDQSSTIVKLINQSSLRFTRPTPAPNSKLSRPVTLEFHPPPEWSGPWPLEASPVEIQPCRTATGFGMWYGVSYKQQKAKEHGKQYQTDDIGKNWDSQDGILANLFQSVLLDAVWILQEQGKCSVLHVVAGESSQWHLVISFLHFLLAKHFSNLASKSTTDPV